MTPPEPAHGSKDPRTVQVRTDRPVTIEIYSNRTDRPQRISLRFAEEMAELVRKLYPDVTWEGGEGDRCVWVDPEPCEDDRKMLARFVLPEHPSDMGETYPITVMVEHGKTSGGTISWQKSPTLVHQARPRPVGMAVTSGEGMAIFSWDHVPESMMEPRTVQVRCDRPVTVEIYSNRTCRPQRISLKFTEEVYRIVREKYGFELEGDRCVWVDPEPFSGDRKELARFELPEHPSCSDKTYPITVMVEHSKVSGGSGPWRRSPTHVHEAHPRPVGMAVTAGEGMAIFSWALGSEGE